MLCWYQRLSLRFVCRRLMKSLRHHMTQDSTSSSLLHPTWQQRSWNYPKILPTKLGPMNIQRAHKQWQRRQARGVGGGGRGEHVLFCIRSHLRFVFLCGKSLQVDIFIMSPRGFRRFRRQGLFLLGIFPWWSCLSNFSQEFRAHLGMHDKLCHYSDSVRRKAEEESASRARSDAASLCGVLQGPTFFFPPYSVLSASLCFSLQTPLLRITFLF